MVKWGVEKELQCRIVYFICFYIVGLLLGFIFGDRIKYDIGLLFGVSAAIYGTLICFARILWLTELN